LRALRCGLLGLCHLREVGLVGIVLDRHPANHRAVVRVLSDGLDDPPVRDLRKTHAHELDVFRVLEQVGDNPLGKNPLHGDQTHIEGLGSPRHPIEVDIIVQP